MHRVDGADHSSNTFTEGPPGTQITADILNAFQEEIANTIEDLGGTLSKPDNTQLVTRLIAVFGRLATANTWSALQSFSGPSGDTNAHEEFDVQPTARKVIFRMRASSGSPAVYNRIYATVDKSFELTCNARWDGSDWIPDSTSFASSKLRVTTADILYSSALAGPASFTDAQLNAGLSSGAIKIVPGDITSAGSPGKILGVRTAGQLDVCGPSAPGFCRMNPVSATLGVDWDGIGVDAEPRYMVDAFGTVHLEGAAELVTVLNDPMFTLPAGYRPTVDRRFPALICDAGGSTLRSGFLKISSAGVVSVDCATIAQNDVVYLDGVSFQVD